LMQANPRAAGPVIDVRVLLFWMLKKGFAGQMNPCARVIQGGANDQL
jgi:hypothetical protein